MTNDVAVRHIFVNKSSSGVLNWKSWMSKMSATLSSWQLDPSACRFGTSAVQLCQLTHQAQTADRQTVCIDNFWSALGVYIITWSASSFYCCVIAVEESRHKCHVSKKILELQATYVAFPSYRTEWVIVAAFSKLYNKSNWCSLTVIQLTSDQFLLSHGPYLYHTIAKRINTRWY